MSVMFWFDPAGSGRCGAPFAVAQVAVSAAGSDRNAMAFANRNSPISPIPHAIVLCRTLTGLATVRALRRVGLSVQALVLADRDLVRYTRLARIVEVPPEARHGEALIEFLLRLAPRADGDRPMLVPTSDEHALLLSEFAATLDPHFRIWNNRFADLSHIVSKEHLYAIAEGLGLPTVPGIVEPTPEQLQAWSAVHAAPYLLKPFYVGVPRSSLQQKNQYFDTREALLDYVHRNGAQAVIVQRWINGGDGYVFDCYGLCDSAGHVVQMATHRRWRQNEPDCGATSFGEIPSGLPPERDDLLITQTQTLLGGLRYHGIFGVEWLLERDTGRFYLIDFNARPFSSVGHLVDCGLNLPALAYRELAGCLPPGLPLRPPLRHLWWIDIYRDLQTFRQLREAGRLGFRQWIVSTLRCRSWAYLDLRDPLPAIVCAKRLLRHLVDLALSRSKRRAGRGGYPASQDATT
ncbi:MAG: hypothetical protein QM741_12405 [Rudaea sp.]|uniref:carboxylate--amine ligase n=1 Tax=Rudaea sp. TaxID=2136325 RepID=UPI0039E2AD54